MNRTGSKILHGLLLATSGLVGSTLIASTAAMAGGGPTGGTVAVGSATIVNASPTQTVVNQSSNKALINWNSFSIPGGSSVKFNQPNSKSLTVNRVTGPNASTIDGALLANGNVWLINANGILFGKGSQINVGALLATTSDLSDDDFKNGNYSFKPATNPNASVVNKGTITAGANGSVILSAPRVSNEGLIQANLGTVVLGGANAFTVDMTGDNLLRYQITAPVTNAPKDSNGSVASAIVSNSGTIMANGGHVMMTARAARNVEDNVINNTGIVEATTVSSHNGVIDLDAGPDGTVNDSGTLDASGSGQGQTGGAVNVTGGTVNVADGAKINASGDAGGGTIQIGGGPHGQGALAHAQRTIIGKATITADATGKGNGGTVAIWSDGDTSFDGSISAKGGAQGGNGGQVETSGHNLGVTASAKVDTSAPLGLTGDWLLDPTDLIISSCGSGCCGSTCFVSSTAIASSLATTDMTESATNSLTLAANSDITWNSTHSLTLLSGGAMTIGSSIQNAGAGNITLIAGWDGSTTNFASLAPSSGAYGATGGDITIGGESANGDIFVGTAHGITTIAGSNVTLSGYNGNATIGYGGAGGGNINVFAKNNIGAFSSGEGGYWATVGNGDGSTPGNVTGNIYLNAGGDTTFVEDDGAYIGNFAANGSTATGNVTVITNSGDLSGGYFADDLGSGAGSGGNVFVGFTGTNGTYSLYGLDNYNSANTFTWAASASLAVLGNVQNAGTGAINLVAGWDGHTTNVTALTTAGVYGNNNGVLTIGSGDIFNVSVGSKGGKTTVLGYDVDLTANLSGGEGHAQIGYNGGGATGAIDVRAVRNVVLTAGNADPECEECVTDAFAQIGHGGSEESGNNSGNISVIAGGNVTLLSGDASFGTYAQIGNGGEENSSTTQASNVTINAANLNLVADEGYAQVGNGGAEANTASTGNIAITVTGNVTLAGGGVDTWGYAQIGNGGDTAHGNDTGNILITAGGNVVVTGGGDYAQIGNGGWGSVGNDAGNITVNATGNIAVTGSNVTSFAYAQIGNGGENQSGTDTGAISVKGNNLTLTAANNGRYAQIGNGSNETGAGSNASGDIAVTLVGNLTLTGAASSSGVSDYALIGNSAFSTSPSNGIAGGNISINVGKTTKVVTTDGEGDAWIGNVSDGGTETGSVSLITRDLDDSADNNDDIGGFIVADLAGGNVTVGITDANATTSIGGLDYTSSNALTILTAGNLTVTHDLENSGTGNLTLVAGWNPAVAAGSVLTTAGSYGVGSKTLTVGGSSASGGVAVGSKGGTTNILTNALMVSGNNGYAQIGYHGVGTGAINVFATGNIVVQAITNGYFAQIGNGDGATSGTVGGNISVTTAGGSLSLIASANNTAAAIGNIAGTNGSESGSIAINTNGGALNLSSTGKWSLAQIGNWANGNTTGTSSGNINIAAGNVSINSAGVRASAGIGNGNRYIGADTGALSGNITIVATSLSISANASGVNADQSRIGNLGYGAVSGNINITTTGNITLVGLHGGLSNIGNLSAPMDSNGNALQGQGTGDIVIQSGGAISLLGNGGEARTESGGATSGNVSVTAAGNITLAVDNNSSTERGTAIIGALTNGNGTVNVAVKSTGGSITLDAADAGSFVDIGNSENGSTGNIGGNVSVVAKGNVTVSSTGPGSIARIGNSGDGNATSGEVSVLAGNILQIVGGNSTASNGSLALVGNTNDQAGGAIAGNVTVTASSVDGIGDSIFNDLAGGNFTLNSLSSKTITIDHTGTYNSSHNLTVNSGGDIVFESSLMNSGSGNITFISAGDVTIGGAGASGDVAVGSKGGVTTITADSLLLSAVNGYAQLGYHGGGSGAIIATIAGDVTLNGGGSTGDYAQIGDGGYKVSGSSSEAVKVIAGGDIALNSGAGQEAYAQIGNGGAESNSNSSGYSETGLITVSGRSVTLNAGSGTGSYAQIGHGGYKSGQGLDGTATIGGDIVVDAVTAIRLVGGGDDAYAQIGHGGDFVNSGAANGSGGTISGDIDVAVATPNTGTGDDPLTLTAGAGIDSYVQIGNGGQGENTPVTGAIVSFDISGNVTVADLTLTGSNTGANGYAQIGNGDISKTGTGNVSGNVALGQGTEITTIPGKAPGAGVGTGNATGFGTVTGTLVPSGIDAGTQGSVASITQNSTGPTNGTITTVDTTPEFTPAPELDTENQSSGPSPLEELADNSEGGIVTDDVAHSVGQSLGEGKTIYVTSKTLIPGVLKQIVTLTPNNPHGVPPADVDYSSWGNEALWRW